MIIRPRQLSIVALALTVVAAVLTGIIAYRERIWSAVSSPVMIEVAVASTPSGADAYVNGASVGKTPLRIPVMQGQGIVELKKAGYEDTSRAFYAAYMPSKFQRIERELNIELKPLTNRGAVPVIAPTVVSRAPTIAPRGNVVVPADPAVMKELRELRSMILANPNEAVTVTALQERVRLQSDEVKALREDIKEVKEQSKWFIGALVAVMMGVFAAVVAILNVFSIFPTVAQS